MSTTTRKEDTWGFWFLVPLHPYRHRRTLRREVVPGTVWTFEQLQGILYTIVPIRMTVVKLASGGLLVYAPIAPTQECIRLVKELEAAHGAVQYILLPTASGLEHKVFVPAFARCFPDADIFVAPHQWSFPVNLPLSWLGFPRQRTHVLPNNSAEAPFADEFDYAILDINLGRGSFVEVALFHKRSRTVLVADTVLSVPETPPEILQLDPYPLLFHARETATDPIVDTEANRRKGWQRIALFATYFQPSVLKTVGLIQAVRDSFKAPDRSKKAYFGLFPFQWQPEWERSFEALRSEGRPFVAPILQALILDHNPQAVIDWANYVASWNFERVIPCHFDAAIATTPAEFRQIFALFEASHPSSETFGSASQPLPSADIDFIRKLEEALDRRGITSSPETKN
ncbi:MAG TPA: DUF4336 domain-containing protein [Oscillatoriaceae cyanobacterium M33_DOE_052]|uniref:DUF4336 domain-containing protein n=1 Tax=Oscillatoriales cyanobacterium SpSt-418 TaxID=2282169 RepID=A0A7C3PCH4_9CYAN|nr:DUF4336 domain-containing protein [Oscillatoriaceae cyanobacterium M33_DOE_052]